MNCGCTHNEFCDEALDLFSDVVQATNNCDRAYTTFARNTNPKTRDKLIAAHKQTQAAWDAYAAHRELDPADQPELTIAQGRERMTIYGGAA